MHPTSESPALGELRNVGVIGAGAMGRGIAHACAAAKCSVKLLDNAGGAVARALETVLSELGQSVIKGRLSQVDADSLIARIVPVDALTHLADCDLVVEAIVEQLEPKQRLFRELEAVVKRDCILATNTSSLSVTAIAAACAAPQRVAGWHFFNPVSRMKLVEVIQAPRTAQDVIEALQSLSERMGYRAVVTFDSPGFVVNHAGRAYVTEGLKLLAERTAGHSVLDGILRTCAGFRMGPFELLDLTGLDVSVPVMESIHAQYYGDDRYRPAALARTRLLAGLLGRKSGQGFYSHDDKNVPGQPVPQRVVPPTGSSFWWPTGGAAALPQSIAALLPADERTADSRDADVIVVSPLGHDLSTTVADLKLDPAKSIGVDPLFGGQGGVTVMTSPATTSETLGAACSIFSAQSIPVFTIADSPGFVAPRVVSCIVNLACEMAQQGIASPADIDVAVRLGLGYPRGPFEWGDQLGAKRLLEILRGLHETFGDPRYRPSPWLVRRARLSLPLSAPDRVD